MTDEHNLFTVGQFDSDAYESSEAAEQTLNPAILHAEEFLEIFET